MRRTVVATFDPFPSPLAHLVGEIKDGRNVVIDALFGGVVQLRCIVIDARRIGAFSGRGRGGREPLGGPVLHVLLCTAAVHHQTEILFRFPPLSDAIRYFMCFPLHPPCHLSSMVICWLLEGFSVGDKGM